MKKFSFLLLIFLLIGCNSSNNTDEMTVETEVQYFGALKNIMHHGDLSAKFDLKDIEAKKNVYALGVMEELEGEIQIFNGVSYTTQVVDSNIQFDRTFNIKAALFMYSVVEDWNSFNIPDSIRSYAQLDNFIERTAIENHIDPNDPFAFRMEGIAASFNWHVIDWPKGDTEHTHNKHVESGLHGTLKNKSVELIGFYSKSHHTILTHHTTNMHIHVKTSDGQLAGHLDGITLDGRMKLLLPRN